MTECKSTLHRSVKYPVWRGHQVWLSFLPCQCIKKKKLQNETRTHNVPLACQIAAFLPSLICPFLLRNAASDAVVLPSDRRKMRTSPRWCRQHCAAQDAQEGGKRQKGISFSPSPLSFVYLFGLSIRPSRLSSPQRVLGQGWMTHVASHVS